jgi:DNA-directed RNA polymerase subunit RPC12/RpoP
MSSAAVVLRPHLQVVALDAAQFCVNCESISNTTLGECPICLSRALLRLRTTALQTEPPPWESEQGVPVLGIGEGR